MINNSPDLSSVLPDHLLSLQFPPGRLRLLHLGYVAFSGPFGW